MAGAGQPAVNHLARHIQRGGDVFADLRAVVAGKLCSVARGAAITAQMTEEVAIGHGPAVSLGRPTQSRTPGQRCGSAEGLRATLARLATRLIDQVKQLLPFGLPVADFSTQQRTGHDDAPITALLTYADVDELWVQENLAVAVLHHL